MRRLTMGLVALIVVLPTAATAVPVEEFAPYRPQTRCSPKAKSGTVQLLNWLIRRYDGTGSLGISRACGHGGVSEHKEGRALDWAVSHRSKRDRRYVAHFFKRAFRTDRHGNEAALARRMGIMYLIWNDHIYSAYNGFEKRDYTASTCRTKKKSKKKKQRCTVTLRHRNHVHISLSRAGGRGDTSWYHRNDPDWEPPTTPEPPATPPTPDDPTDEPETPDDPWDDPVIDFDRSPYARIVVPADGRSVTTDFSLQKGRSYKLTAAGLYGYGGPRHVADASCVWRPGPREWRPRPSSDARRDHGALELRVNGKGLFSSSCRSDHTYTVTFRPTRTKPMRLRVANNDGSDAVGGLVLTVSRRGTDVRRALPVFPTLDAAPTRAESAARGFGMLAESLDVPARSAGVTTRRELEAGAVYRISVSGRVGLGRGVRSDGHCLRIGDTWWRRASLDRRFPDADHGGLYIDGAPLTEPRECGLPGYTVEHTPDRDGRVRLAVWDPLDRSDNSGSLHVTVQRVTPFASPREAKPRKPKRTRPWRRTAETLTVAADDANGVRSRMALRKGERVQLVVSGTTRSHGVRGDATCVRTPEGWRKQDPSLAVDQDPLELWVEGRPRRWRAVTGSQADADCSGRHVYTRRLRAGESGPLRLGILDLDHRDNRGELTVTLVRGKKRWTDAAVLRLVRGRA